MSSFKQLKKRAHRLCLILIDNTDNLLAGEKLTRPRYTLEWGIEGDEDWTLYPECETLKDVEQVLRDVDEAFQSRSGSHSELKQH